MDKIKLDARCAKEIGKGYMWSLEDKTAVFIGTMKKIPFIKKWLYLSRNYSQDLTVKLVLELTELKNGWSVLISGGNEKILREKLKKKNIDFEFKYGCFITYLTIDNAKDIFSLIYDANAQDWLVFRSNEKESAIKDFNVENQLIKVSKKYNDIIFIKNFENTLDKVKKVLEGPVA